MWSIIVIARAEPVAERVLDAVGETESEVRLPRFGRYAFEVRSEVGTALTVVDRMEGPSRPGGRVGEVDGRLDGFFDVGTAKVKLEAPADGRGKAHLTVTAFDDRGQDEALVRHRPVITELVDKEARGWWVDAGSERLQLEVVGRYLGDVRLWLQGSWLVDASPRCSVVEPSEGQPLTRCVLDTRVEPGLYRVVAYGGPGRDWANEAADRMLSVRWDAPELPPEGVRVGRIGPTGVDYFRTSDASVAHLTLPEIAPAAVALDATDSVFVRSEGSARITDESRTPEATSTGGKRSQQVLTVSGAPGQRYELRWFDSSSRRVQGSGKVLVSSLSTARSSDTLAPTAVFARRKPDVLARTAGLELAAGTRFEETFNLLATQQLLIELPADIDVRFRIPRGSARLRLEPYFTTKPEGYTAPPFRSGEWKDRHLAGTYVLTIEPEEPGIVTLEGAANGWGDVALENTTGLRRVRLPAGLREVLELDAGAPLTAETFTPPDSRNGLVVRSLPLDPTVPAPIHLAPGERFALPVRVSRTTTVRALRPNGERLPLEVAGRTDTTQVLEPGSWAVVLHNDGDAPVLASLGAEPAPEPVARVPRERLASLPSFEELSADRPHFTDLERNRSTTLQLEVEDDGLYLLESTGLLATRGSLRSRVKLDLGEGDQNGVGRNFRVDRYLRSGTYQVTVATRGQSQGHLGVELHPAELAEGGMLELGRVARATVPAGQGVAYDLTIDSPRYVHVESRAPDQRFPCRLEDEDGYPVVRPVETCDLRVRLTPGRYRLISSPIDVDSKRHTVAKVDTDVERLEGHGPHPLPLGRTISHVWVEPPGDGERPVDTFAFTLPADLEVTLDAGDEMAGTLFHGDEPLARLTPGRAWKGRLERGDYRLELRAARRGTGIPYTVRASTDRVTIGQRRGTSLPATLEIEVGEAGPVAITSSGDADVRARLVDAEGRVVVANDDRPDDWNFRIARWLEPGTWRLELDRVGRDRFTTVHVDAPEERAGEPLSQGRQPTPIPLGDGTTVHPLDVGNRATLHVHGHSSQNLALAVEQRTAAGWSSLGSASGRTPSLFVRRSKGAELRLRVASLDGRSGTASITVDASGVRTVRDRSAEEGLASNGPQAWSGKGLTPGLYRVGGDRSGLVVCPDAGVPCRPAPGVVAVGEQTVFFGTTLQLARAALDAEPVPIELAAGRTVLETGIDGPVAMVLRARGDAGVALDDGATALSERGVLALGEGDAMVWGRGVGRLQAVALASREATWDDDRIELELPPRSRTVLPSRARRLESSLEADTVVARGRQALWADGEALSGTLGGNGPVALVNLSTTPKRVRLRTMDAPGEGPEWQASRAGTDIVTVRRSDGLLQAHEATLLYLRDDGVVLRGDVLEAGPGGIAWVQHGTGWHAAWTGVGPWNAARNTTLPVSEGVHELEVDAPFAVKVDDRVFWRPEGGAVRFRVARDTRVAVRGLIDEVQPTVRRLDAPALGEGLGPEVLLDAGGSAWFRLTVEEAGPLGFGVRATADRVRATLHADDGAVLASGVVQRVELEPGTYWLELAQDAHAAPVRARPAIAGLERPDRGPPNEVVQRYLEAAGLVAGGSR